MWGDHSYSEPPAGAVTCLSCGLVSIGMTRAETEARVARVNSRLLPGEEPIGLDYFTCCRAPRYRPARIGDVPDGATMGYVLAEGV
ncbi:hypothetical protein MMSR116_15775 [Methylobacterium mesophilicum SR1.6/6]|uniref:Uncharacterized protein n=1 Tax=Methylobacterium mesophilicum SR1.6/6 TaxID=908290 RepID=A0A6B9FKR5_9HYPH|nr:hypothetical protein [Methylobacterium mesophilicum]QGY03180.1 hypothetical protein MMSR116_15775 [Methylobacterium mesophilicum SR1.6/6]